MSIKTLIDNIAGNWCNNSVTMIWNANRDLSDLGSKLIVYPLKVEKLVQNGYVDQWFDLHAR